MINEYSIKQQLLQAITAHEDGKNKIEGGTSNQTLSTHLNVSFALCWVMADEMVKSGYLIFHKSASIRGDERLYTSTQHGRYFLETGGYYTQRRKAFYKRAWEQAKTLAIIANAITALVLSYYSYKAAEVNNELQEREQLKGDVKDIGEVLLNLLPYLEKSKMENTKTSPAKDTSKLKIPDKETKTKKKRPAQ